jgi:hypothetical protein
MLHRRKGPGDQAHDTDQKRTMAARPRELLEPWATTSGGTVPRGAPVTNAPALPDCSTMRHVLPATISTVIVVHGHSHERGPAPSRARIGVVPSGTVRGNSWAARAPERPVSGPGGEVGNDQAGPPPYGPLRSPLARPYVRLSESASAGSSQSRVISGAAAVPSHVGADVPPRSGCVSRSGPVLAHLHQHTHPHNAEKSAFARYPVLTRNG